MSYEFAGIDHDGFEMPAIVSMLDGPRRPRFTRTEEALISAAKSQMGVARAYGNVTKVEQVGDERVSVTFDIDGSRVIESVSIGRSKMAEILGVL